jgi:hypothetical protein
VEDPEMKVLEEKLRKGTTSFIENNYTSTN